MKNNKNAKNKWSKEFHQISKNIFDDNYSRSETDITTWPESWTTTFIKEYSRFPKIKLPKPESINATLSEIILNRKTERFHDSGSLNLNSLSNCLFYSFGEMESDALSGRGRRAVSSAGARYPLEMYVFITKNITGLKTGLYHYRADLHELEYIYEFMPDKKFLEELFSYKWADDFKACFFITSIFSRTQDKYNERGYRYALLEAGAVSQMLQHTATSQNINSVIFGGTYDNKVEELLDIDGFSESLVSTVLIR